jgi:hypothetical protein
MTTRIPVYGLLALMNHTMDKSLVDFHATWSVLWDVGLQVWWTLLGRSGWMQATVAHHVEKWLVFLGQFQTTSYVVVFPSSSTAGKRIVYNHPVDLFVPTSPCMLTSTFLLFVKSMIANWRWLAITAPKAGYHTWCSSYFSSRYCAS